MSATEAIVQFIGIIMMTAGVPNDPGVHAIVPRIERSGIPTSPVDRRQAVARAHRSAAGISVPFHPQGVETHTAVILYEKSAKVGISNWTPVTFRQTWEYVVLTGERLQFVTGAVNAAPAVPRDLPRACPTNALQTNFQPPQYAGAAAVVDIDEGFLDVCLARPANSSATGRADTRLFLKTNGSLVIVGTKANAPAKTITLVPDARLYIANIPPRHLDIAGAPTISSGPAHHTVYDTMTGSANCAPVPDTGNVCRMCETSAMKMGGGGYPNDPLMIDSECSNSQWP
jgi:hypothetical protein